MITVTETSKKTKTLNTSEEIATFLKRHHRGLVKDAAFKPGEVVRITNRAGIPPDICIGDRVVILFEATPGLVAHVLALNSGGAPVQFVAQVSNLAKIEEGGSNE